MNKGDQSVKRMGIIGSFGVDKVMSYAESTYASSVKLCSSFRWFDLF